MTRVGPGAPVDVVVVGAGPAGSATALWLARAGCRVVLVERSSLDQPRPGESLAPVIGPLLRQLGVWDQFIALNPLPSYGTRSIWGSPDADSQSHLATPDGHGWHVDRSEFNRMLAGAAAAAGAELRCRAAVVGQCRESDGTWAVHIDGRGSVARTPLRAHVLMDATGRAARVARRLGAERIVIDRMIGIAAQVHDVDVSKQGFVLVETTPQGWWYSAPIPQNRMVVALMTDSDICRQGNLATSVRWSRTMAAANVTAARVPGPPRWGPHIFPATSQRLHRNESHAPWLAVGDAALAVDPLSGAGVTTAMRSSRAAADSALALLQGRAAAVVPYERALDEQWYTYLEQRALYYGLEQRWPESPFWRRRTH